MLAFFFGEDDAVELFVDDVVLEYSLVLCFGSRYRTWYRTWERGGKERMLGGKD
jgi:hypothetical protein